MKTWCLIPIFFPFLMRGCHAVKRDAKCQNIDRFNYDSDSNCFYCDENSLLSGRGRAISRLGMFAFIKNIWDLKFLATPVCFDADIGLTRGGAEGVQKGACFPIFWAKSQ